MRSTAWRSSTRRRRLAPTVGRKEKPPGEKKNKVLPVRFTDDDYEEIRHAAGHERLEMSAWVRKVALDAAATVNDRAAKKAAKRGA